MVCHGMPWYAMVVTHLIIRYSHPRFKDCMTMIADLVVSLGGGPGSVRCVAKLGQYSEQKIWNMHHVPGNQTWQARLFFLFFFDDFPI